MDTTTTPSSSSFSSSEGRSYDAAATPAAVQRALELLQMDDLDLRVEAAREIRRLTKTSHRCRRRLRRAVGPLVSMLRGDSPESHEPALLALLNLAVKDETNKISIVEACALEPIISFLKSQNLNLQEYATATLLTLSASATIKPIISASGVIPLLVEILRDGSPQAKADAVMALSNLSAQPNNLSIILETNPIPFIVNLLKTCKNTSKTAEKCSALIESLVSYDEGRTALTSEEGGVLAVVEVLENGTLQSREHAVGTLLTMCESDRCKYREPILREGVIPGLLELTIQGTPKSQPKARTLLQLLRESPYPRPEVDADTLENIVSNIISQIDGDDQCGKAKKMVAEMVQVSMEQSLRHLQQRALVCTPTDLPVKSSTASQVSSNLKEAKGTLSLVQMVHPISEIEELSSMEEGANNPSSKSNTISMHRCCSSNYVVTMSQKVIAEFIGTYFVVFAGCGSVAVNKIYGSITFPGVCITWGLIVMVMIYSVGHISGAHFNPAVTISWAIFRRLPFKEVPLYIIAQFLGSVLASGTLALTFNVTSEAYFGTVPVGSIGQSLATEIIITFLLMFVISAVSTDDRALGDFTGVAVGMTIMLNVFIAGPISGASMNPVRSIGPALIKHVYKGLWVYIVGPIIGAIAGAFVYNFLRSTDEAVSDSTTGHP
ncbi:hypothetical protein RIF29_17404 [Crotalaria pallida]|uniref:U-box domain-containing protein n=1 Tax=Crotalaria pallida TaxID=3830 RepID=A0AAN9IKD7_CROPI